MQYWIRQREGYVDWRSVWNQTPRPRVPHGCPSHGIALTPDGKEVWSYPNGGEMEQAIVSAAEAVGIRLTLLDTIYLGGGVGDSPLSDAQRRFSDETVEAWAQRRDSTEVGPLARIGAGIHSVRAVPPSLFGEIGAASVGIPLHAHVSEQPAENVAALRDTGHTPTELFAKAGLLGPEFTAVHGTHLSGTDIELLGQTGSNVCFTPTTERIEAALREMASY